MKVSKEQSIEDLKKKISDCLFWHHWIDESEELPICVADPEKLKKLLE